ncbi:hypothetical protein NKJ35_13800 [Mesorhizobium sp. M0136]|uniref:hypothetical protein n=1 Tax=Mesorhizobium sp. M0136 TaxID=2956890 RepID=UPI00333DB922
MTRKTLADTLSARETIYVNCAHPMCCKSTKLDIQALIDRLGHDHGSMHGDLVGLFVCSNCKAAGRDRPSSHAFLTTKAISGAQSRLEANFRTKGLKVAGAAWGALG